MIIPAKPPRLFDRDAEWAALAEFVTSPEEGPRLGLVSGRRRQGKTFLLQALVAMRGGFYSQTPSLGGLGWRSDFRRAALRETVVA